MRELKNTVECIEVIMDEGDVLYVPSGWSHIVISSCNTPWNTSRTQARITESNVPSNKQTFHDDGDGDDGDDDDDNDDDDDGDGDGYGNGSVSETPFVFSVNKFYPTPLYRCALRGVGWWCLRSRLYGYYLENMLGWE
jgi:hypothetical protein